MAADPITKIAMEGRNCLTLSKLGNKADVTPGGKIRRDVVGLRYGNAMRGNSGNRIRRAALSRNGLVGLLSPR